MVRKTRGRGCLGVEGLSVEPVEVGSLWLGLGVRGCGWRRSGCGWSGCGWRRSGCGVEMEERVLWIRSVWVSSMVEVFGEV